jgi:lipopolysaccharide transport system ATP-binding protein
MTNDSPNQHANDIVRCTNINKTFLTYKRPLDRLLDSLQAIIKRKGPRGAVRAGRFVALEDISFKVAKGETVGIIGRNGSGKSTLLQIIAGTLEASAGTLSVTGNASALLELGAGFNPEFSGIENVWLNGSLMGLSNNSINQRLSSILAFADIGEHASLALKTYSSGMYVRLAFSIMAHSDPDLLIVDEALAVGDAAFQAKCMMWMRAFTENGGTLLFVSHDTTAVRTLCDRAIYLERGRIKNCGPVGAVTDHYLRDIHDELNHQMTASLVRKEACLEQDHRPETRLHDIDRFMEFERQWVPVRQGTGEARVRFAEMLDAEGGCHGVYAFNAPVRIRVYVECLRACTVSVNYKVRDRMLVSVIGCDFLIAEQELLTMLPGRIYITEYATRLSVCDGDYTLRFSITIPIDRHRQAVFVDIVEVALPFKVLPPEQGWIYTQAYVSNTVSIKTCSIQAKALCEDADGSV